jgi:hypothetical protein
VPAANTLGVIPAIVARLRDQVDSDDWQTVASIGITAGAQNLDGYLPALFVVDGGGVYTDQDYDTAAVEMQQVMISICVKNVRDPLDVATPDKTAGLLKGQVEAALVGWVPAEGYGALQAIARDPADYNPTFVEYLLTFAAPCAVGD